MKSHTSFAKYLLSVCRCFEKDIFLVELATGREISYQEFLEKVKCAAVYLKGAGLKAEDEMLLRMDNSVSALVVFFGAILAEIIPVPVSPKLSNDDLKKIFNNSEQVNSKSNSNINQSIEISIRKKIGNN